MKEDDAFLQDLMRARMAAAALQPRKDPHEVVRDFLRTTKTPYAIIGGKAAAFHLNTRVAPGTDSPSLLQLAKSTLDYDVMIKQTDASAFIQQLQQRLAKESRIPLDEKRYEGAVVDIVLMGHAKDGLLDSIVDVHILKEKKGAHPTHFPPIVHGVGDDAGLRFASWEWVCKELAYSLQYHSSHGEAIKSVKRQVRRDLLKCDKESS